jgi:hypothetical protein
VYTLAEEEIRKDGDVAETPPLTEIVYVPAVVTPVKSSA